ncbi:calcitonin gene-related peptide type 1 receptor-like [Haliotis cracherodii]|uniref:calcitonin gene-related peptide type 1 receptor-like n=1 Tax=Haliotis cracherodii TaxID=6455 RepID=UPI0039ECEBBD
MGMPPLVLAMCILLNLERQYTLSEVQLDTVSPPMLCRNRDGLQPLYVYTIYSCVECYWYLFLEGGKLNVSCGGLCLKSSSESTVRPHPDDHHAMGIVCSTLSATNCTWWTSCCSDAAACCQQEQKSRQVQDGSFCPMTWDGWSCVAETPAGITAEIKCPDFIPSSRPEARAHRKCTSNGTWWRKPASNTEWTDYSSCIELDLNGETATQIVAIVCDALSILFLIPAIAIFTGFRLLRCHRHIKLHTNLCVALLLKSITSMPMEKLVYYDSLFTEQSKTFQQTNQVGCRVLNVLDLLFHMCPVFWMLCESFYLTWLMIRSFQQLTSVIGFYTFGWGLPILIVVIYVFLKTQVDADSPCWLTSPLGLDWVVYGPSLVCIAINLLLFLIILKTLFTLRRHPREPSNFRKALKATVILIPLFGLQQFCIIYSPADTVPGFIVYNMARAIIIHSQGLLVALLFCFLNTEVHGHINMVWKRWHNQSRQNSHRNTATLTSASLSSQRTSLPEIEGLAVVMKSQNGRVKNDALTSESIVINDPSVTGQTSTQTDQF